MQKRFENLLSHYQSGDHDNCESQKKSISQAIENSEIGNFFHSDLNVLEELGIRGYFDMDSVKRIDSILEFHEYEIRNRLAEFVNRRVELLENVRQLAAYLKFLGVKQEEANTYQIILSLPNQYQGLDELERFIKDAKLLLQELNSHVKESQPLKIVSVNNGSIELSIVVDLPLVEQFLVIMFCLNQIRKLLLEYSNLKVIHKRYKGGRKEQADEIALSQLNEDVEQALAEAIDVLPVKSKEARTRINQLIGMFGEHTRNGVIVEVKTPIIKEPDTPTDEGDKASLRKSSEVLKQIEIKKKVDIQSRQLYLSQKEEIHLRLHNPKEKSE